MDRIEKAVARGLAPALVAHGFQLDSAWNGFVRATPHGKDAFVIVNGGTASREFFEIRAHCHVRHDRIEVPWNACEFVYGEDNQQQTWTVQLSRPRNLPKLKVRAASIAEDAAAVAAQLADWFEREGVPFFAQFANLRAVEALANTVPLQHLSRVTQLSVGGPLDHRAMRSLLLAKAVNPDRYAAVREAFLASNENTIRSREHCLRMLERIDAMTTV